MTQKGWERDNRENEKGRYKENDRERTRKRDFWENRENEWERTKKEREGEGKI